MKLFKTASGKKMLKLNKEEWTHIGRIAGWLSSWCANCGGKMWPKSGLQIDPLVVKDRHDPHYGDVFSDDNKPDVKSHGICNKCGKELYPTLEKENPSIFSNPINDIIAE